MNAKRICLLIPSLHTGGMERVMSELAAHFCQKSDLEVHLVLYGINRDIFYNLPDNLTIHRPSFEFDNDKRLLHTLKTLWFLRTTIRRLNPDSVLSFGEYWNNFVLLALYGLRYPVYVSDRCQPDKSLGRVHDMLRNHLYRNAKGVIAQTIHAKRIYEAMYQHPCIAVIGNPIRSIVPQTAIQREKVVLSVGRLIASKHHDELIRLFVRVRRPGWKLIIVGDDAIKQQNKSRLQALIEDLGATDCVELAGKRNDVENFYLRSSIFAFTSSSEGFPNVIGEAQSAGLPVVAFDCIAGPSDMIQDGENGFLVPLFNYELFAERLAALMDNSVLREQLGQAAQQSIRKFSTDAIGEKFYTLLTNSAEKAV
jgi:glycosyltransferase involved in cell wall biosynthesis